MPPQDRVSTICLKNLVEVLIVLVTPVSQIDMQCALIIVMAKVTVSFRSLTFWSLRAFPVAWMHNQAGCWPGSSPAGRLPEKKTTSYIPQNSWEKDNFSSIVSNVCYWVLALCHESCCSLLTLISLDKYQQCCPKFTFCNLTRDKYQMTIHTFMSATELKTSELVNPGRRQKTTTRTAGNCIFAPS